MRKVPHRQAEGLWLAHSRKPKVVVCNGRLASNNGGAKYAERLEQLELEQEVVPVARPKPGMGTSCKKEGRMTEKPRSEELRDPN